MNAVLALTYTTVDGFPAGSVVAAIVATITGVANPTPQVQSVAPGTASITFPNVPADTYSLSVAAQDASGNTFGTPVNGTFTITAPATVSLSLPSAVTATQS